MQAGSAARPQRRVLLPVRISPAMRRAIGSDRLVRTLSGPTMGTTWQVTAMLQRGRDPAPVAAMVEQTLERIEAQMSPWRPSSDLVRYNAAPPATWVKVPAEMIRVVAAALALAADTDGAFDPGLGALISLWGFGAEGPVSITPTGRALQAARGPGAWRQVLIDEPDRRLYQPGDMRLDLCGIAKGFAVDLVARQLRALDIDDFLVEIGGELRGEGIKPDGHPWWVALEQPDGSASDCIIGLHGLSIATSGDYRRSFEYDGRHFHHTLDPARRAPCADNIASVTVVHENCQAADGLATALSVLGLAGGLDYAERNDIAMRLVLRTPDGLQAVESSAFAAMAA